MLNQGEFINRHHLLKGPKVVTSLTSSRQGEVTVAGAEGAKESHRA